MKPVRRVVTVNRNGKSVFSHDETVETLELGILPGGAISRVFGALSSAGSDETAVDLDSYWPAAGGVTVTRIKIPPDPESPTPEGFDSAPLVEEAMEKLPGFIEVMEPDGSGMHTTPTLDIVTIMSGQVVLELDDGETRTLEAGDVLVQRATRHAWRNPFDDSVVLQAISIGIPD